MIWGIDIGTRSLYLAGLDEEDRLSLDQIILAPKSARYLELTGLATWLTALLSPHDTVFIEEPPKVRNVRTVIQLAEVVGAVCSLAVPTYPTPVASWKKATVGKGNAEKSDVSNWLDDRYPLYSSQCGDDQNLVDATCIALYGRGLVDHPDPALAVR